MYICRFILSYSTIYASDLSFMIDTWSVVELKLMHLACTALSVTKRRASQPVTHALNDVVARAFSAAGIPISKTLLYMAGADTPLGMGGDASPPTSRTQKKLQPCSLFAGH